MPSKLTRYAEGLMEVIWLAALILVPVFFNIYSSRIFEPDKIAILRSLVLLGLGAWIVKIIEEGQIDWGRARQEGESPFRSLLRIPMVAPVLALALAYIIATIFSVTPRISFFGSYQRLQGTYTTFSYLVLFGLAAVHLRRKEQIERLVTTVIVSSLAVSMYAVLQKFEIDPIPWGGDTARRVAANLGNAIFVAAYLIMAFPLTFGRIVDSFTNILDESVEQLGPHILRGTIYVFTAAMQLIAIYFSLSRGPILGLLAGTFFIVVLLSLYWGKRWLTFTAVGGAAVLGAFLVVLSIPGGPLDALRSNENIGRLGNVFDTEGGTGRVRVLIWEGAARLTGFHDPLQYPDGSSDTFNFLRPLIGYGPESMYVAYNSVYPPELGSIESRNASPDRSHNETWDALVITGWLGLAAEQFVFLSAFFFGLKWLGLVRSARQRSLFLALLLGGGILSAVLFGAFMGVGFIGVGLPFGILLGLIAYLSLIALFGHYEAPEGAGARARALTLTMFLGAIISHYVEIHFGIAIAATRTHFWLYYAVLLSAGYWMTLGGQYGPEAYEQLTGKAGGGEEVAESKPSRKTRGKRTRKLDSSEQLATHAYIFGSLGGILLAALTFNYLTNTERLTNIGAIVTNSLTRIPGQTMASYGILAIFLLAWLAFSLLAAAEWTKDNPEEGRAVFTRTALLSGLIWFVYTIVHAGGLTSVIQSAAGLPTDTSGMDSILRQAAALEGLLTVFYIILLLLALGAAFFTARTIPGGTRRSTGSLAAGLTAAGVLLLVLFASAQSNLQTIQADIAFKLADPFGRGDNPDSWRIALELYQRANEYAPQQDHYYLYLGRGYLELTRLIQGDNPGEARTLMQEAETDLKRAQRINPLNTDHTANLARLYRFWANVPGADTRTLLERSSEYYERAVVLSPNNAGIWNEWGALVLQDLSEPERGLEIFEHSLEVDPYFDGTYGYLGDYYSTRARNATDPAEKQAAVQRAADNYSQALERARKKSSRYLYAAALGGVYGLVQDYEQSIAAYKIALENAGDSQVWLVEDTIAKVYAQAQEYDAALQYAELALLHAPEEQKETQQQLIDYIQGLQQTP